MDNSNWWKHVIAGAFAGGVSRTVTAPLDRIKVLLQVQGAQLVSIRGCYYYMIKEGGVKSFWMGNGINVMKVAPENALKFTFHDQVTSFVNPTVNPFLFLLLLPLYTLYSVFGLC